MKKYFIYTLNAINVIVVTLFVVNRLNKWFGTDMTGLCNYLLDRGMINQTGWIMLYDIMSFIKVIIGLIVSVIVLAFIHTVVWKKR